jgi:3',5'-cyclic AMP phosphodiesterase CpdA
MTARLDRRAFLAGSLTVPWLAHPIGKRAEAAETSEECRFYFVVAADPQLFWGPKELWQKAIDEVNRLRPAFLVVCGDLIQDPGNEEQAKAYLEVAGKLDESIPLHNVAGNHDVHKQPTPQSLGWYEKHFGKPWYSFTHAGCLGIVLESDVLNQPAGAPEMAERQMDWLRKTLEAASEKPFDHIFVFQHHPLCLKQVDEPDGYFNVPEARRKELLDLFHKHGVRAVFSGHYHRNAHVKDGQIELITTSSLGKPLGKDPVGLRIVKVFADRIEHRYYGYEELPDKP